MRASRIELSGCLAGWLVGWMVGESIRESESLLFLEAVVVRSSRRERGIEIKITEQPTNHLPSHLSLWLARKTTDRISENQATDAGITHLHILIIGMGEKARANKCKK